MMNLASTRQQTRALTTTPLSISFKLKFMTIAKEPNKERELKMISIPFSILPTRI